jgi:microcystin-dependent protein
MGISAGVGNTGTVPVGVVNPFAGTVAPAGWLLCDGRSTGISRTTYAGLFAVIGTTYGSGDGSTTFNLPDLRGRVVAGADNMGGTDAGRLSTSNTLGTTTGAETVVISSANLPNHSHAIDHDHAAFTSGDDSPDHTHGIGYTFVGYAGGGTVSAHAGGTSTYASTGASRHQHNINVPNFTGTSGNGGFANTGVNNMQPTMVLNYIIKAA